MTTLTYSYHILINASPQAAFVYVSDLTRHPEWSGGRLRVEALDPGPVAVGSRYLSHGDVAGQKDRPNPLRVTQYQAPAIFAFVAQDPGFGEVLHEFIFTQQSGGTLVDRRVTTTMGPLMAMMFRLLIRPLIGKPMMDKSLAALKAKLEERSR